MNGANSTPQNDEAHLNDPQYWYARGEELASLGQYEQALNCYDKSLNLQPDNIQAWIQYGCILTQLDRYAEALIGFEAALALDPRDETALLFKGVALHQLGDYEQAYLVYDRAEGVERGMLSTQLLHLGHKLLAACGFSKPKAPVAPGERVKR
ncbi:tetratricopeptide repeat protein [Oscillatoria sp. FACHB-1406]|uniref:tetratricopeptide repeat protein n=1 Tax=Oscillatoria sp. FACHB-1406 TaxID=2692846 RepID=UPI0016886931|nr:tetratricopeptide repeat protein [Oscillatoria sp. FACHB-1406]MBD2577502.1 tetratricopeptide repeat protein [Oscillatoria sp. FACHB-1406]